jgi:hypothetical protein
MRPSSSPLRPYLFVLRSPLNASVFPPPTLPATDQSPRWLPGWAAAPSSDPSFPATNRNNSYEATFGNDGWGARAQQVLGQVRGKDFRHEKTKKKRGSYRGGKIELGTASIKFADSDDE